MGESNNAASSSKILVDFLRDFTLLTEHQLMTIRSLMASTVSEVMDTVASMSNVASYKKEKANEILVKDAKSDEFVSASSKNLEQDEQKSLEARPSSASRKDYLTNKLMRTGGLFSKHMEAISGLDEDLQVLIAKVMGAVSVDDVIAQRLSHIIDSLGELQVQLAVLLGEYSQGKRSDKVKEFRNKVLTQVYLSYTSEDEKEIFHKVFGHPKEQKKAV